MELLLASHIAITSFLPHFFQQNNMSRNDIPENQPFPQRAWDEAVLREVAGWDEKIFFRPLEQLLYRLPLINGAMAQYFETGSISRSPRPDVCDASHEARVLKNCLAGQVLLTASRAAY